jgi:hypothetical protein
MNEIKNLFDIIIANELIDEDDIENLNEIKIKKERRSNEELSIYEIEYNCDNDTNHHYFIDLYDNGEVVIKGR